MKKERFKPEGADEFYHDLVDATVYTYQRGEKFIALAYSGKRSKPDFHYNFKTYKERETYIHKWIDRLDEIKKEKELRRKERVAFRHDLKVGDIFLWSWGWEQTNVDFYQIIELVGQTIVKVREIKQKTVESQGYSPMAGMTTALKDEVIENAEILIKKVSKGNYIRMASYGSAKLWDGEPTYVSWYG